MFADSGSERRRVVNVLGLFFSLDGAGRGLNVELCYRTSRVSP